MEEPRFVGTPWRGREELLEFRSALFGSDAAAKREAVDRARAWKLRGVEVPLLLESTVDLVEVRALDEGGALKGGALSLAYAAAVARFITGLTDTQTEFARARPSWFLPAQAITFPTALRETRHCIVHRHLPSLAELKLATKESLDWLWEWYWSHLDAAFAADTPQGGKHLTDREARERLQAVLKSYVKERKAEIKRRGWAEMTIAENAAAAFLMIDVSVAARERILLDLLLEERAMLPADKKMGSSMSGAFLIWDPFLLTLCGVSPRLLHALLEHHIASLGASATGLLELEVDPAREGWYEWCKHIVASEQWEDVRRRDPDHVRSGVSAQARLLESVLGLCFTMPAFWTLKLAEEILKVKEFPAKEQWLLVLEAARSDDMGMATETGEPASSSAQVKVQVEAGKKMSASHAVTTNEKESGMQEVRGPRKRAGFWRPVPIGTLMGGG